MLGFDVVLLPGIACEDVLLPGIAFEETFALLDGLLTFGFYEAFSLNDAHELMGALFGRLACT